MHAGKAPGYLNYLKQRQDKHIPCPVKSLAMRPVKLADRPARISWVE